MGVGGAVIGLGAAQSAYQGFRGVQQSDILNQNADITAANAPYVRAAAKEKARQLQVASYLMQGRQKAGYAGAGLAVGGSVFDVMNDTVANYTRDASFAILEGELQARGMQRQADLYRVQAKSTMRDAIVGGMLNFGSTAVAYQTIPKYVSSLSVLGAGGYGGYSSMQGQRLGIGVPTLGTNYP